MTQHRYRSVHFGLIALATGGLLACAPASEPPETPRVAQLSTPSLPGEIAPPGAPANTCWHKTETPAVIETLTTNVLISPADVSPDGLVRAPARYRKEETQRIAVPRQANWTELICPADLTPDFLTTLQRALAARGLHAGQITGQLDAQTADAILRYQARSGLELADLTVQSAQELGLITARR